MLGILVIAWFTRWDYKATKTFDDFVVKWKIDRWTGYRWVEVFSVDSWEKPAYSDQKQKDNALKYRKIATFVWYGLFGINFIWLIISWLLLPKKQGRNDKLTKKDEEIQT